MAKRINSHKIERKTDTGLKSMYTNENDESVIKRITVTLDEEVHSVLQEWADEEARSVPNLLAYLALKAARERQSEKEKEPSRSSEGKE